MRVAAFVVVVCGLAVLLTTDALQATPALPFYDGPDFTPHWSRSVNHRIADFTLVTQTGEPLRRSDLMGRVHVATFVYTRCSGVCPAMITQLSKVQRAIQGRSDAVIVSYSVTPALDTPEMLAAFGSSRNIDPSSWKLVTGDAHQIYALARESYFADDERLDANQPADEQFLHSEKALLVDRDGRLRGVYNATVPHDIDKLVADLNVLMAN